MDLFAFIRLNIYKKNWNDNYFETEENIYAYKENIYAYKEELQIILNVETQTWLMQKEKRKHNSN